mmetsp:Transcript_10157/g.43205  ORF Transcript_10157/g.43205 Transcript_10157/m.43205 type:complete len:202 (+) Transcript_10157:31-636(+)
MLTRSRLSMHFIPLRASTELLLRYSYSMPRASMYASTLSARRPSPALSNARVRDQHMSSVGACPAASASMKTPSADATMSSRSYMCSMDSKTGSGMSASGTALISAYAFAASRCLSAAHADASASANAATLGAAALAFSSRIARAFSSSVRARPRSSPEPVGEDVRTARRRTGAGAEEPSPPEGARRRTTRARPPGFGRFV